MRKTLLSVLALGLALAAPIAAKAQTDFPNKPVKMIVPFPPGGTTDSIARLVAERLGAKWNQQVLVDNKAGAGGNIGAAQFARSEGDGYTLLAAPPGPLAVNFNLYKGLNYDARSFVPVSMIANMPNVLVVGPSLKARTLAEVIAHAKASPGKLTYATQGNGSTSHLTSVLFQSLTGIDMIQVPYRGSSPALVDLMGGKIDLMFDNLTTSLPFHTAKRVTIVAAATKTRIPALPDVPTMSEAGLPDFESGTWVGLVAAPGTPPAIAEQISRDVAEALKHPEVVRVLGTLGAEPVGGTPAATAAYLKAEAAKWKKVIETANITAD